MRKLLLIFALTSVFYFTSCDNSTETTEPPVDSACGLEYIIRTDVSGLILEYGALRDTNMIGLHLPIKQQ